MRLMAEFDVFPLKGECKVVVQSKSKKFPKILDDQVDKIWSLAVEENSHLFNGLIYHFERISQQVVYGQFVEYKYFYACTTDPELQTQLKLFPLGITGITRCGGKTLIGKRSTSVTLFQGMFEFVPAGSIDPQVIVNNEVDLNRQFVIELEEETGISDSFVDSITPYLLVRDNQKKLVDIVARIELSERALDYTWGNSSEYSEIRWMDDDTLRRHFEQQKDNYVPLMSVLYRT